MATAKDKKHQEFINQYFLCNLNQTEAYLRVYPKSSYDAARANSSRLIAEDSIKAEIDARLAELKMSADEVLIRLANMARANIADFAHVQTDADLGNLGDAGQVIKKFKRKVTYNKDDTRYEEIELELYPADVNLERVGKAHGLFKDAGSSEDKPFIVKVVRGVSIDDL